MLFRALRIGPVTVVGRLARSATAERAADENGRPTEALRDILLDLARGDAPWVNTGYVFAETSGRAGPLQAGIHSDDLTPVWKSLIAAVRREGVDTRLFIQLAHGGRQADPACVAEPVAPSALPVKDGGVKPREMTKREIEECIAAFGEAARRAREAGFDGVQLHAAHGYLLSEFLSPYTNRRADEWGGTPERRRRMLIETLRCVREKAGSGVAVTVKLNAEDFIQDGLSLAESCEVARALAAEGVDAIEVSAWMLDGDRRMMPVRKGDFTPAEEGYFLQQAVEIKRAAGATPVGPCGGFRSADVMNRVLGAEGLDFIAASRPFIAEPDLARRLRLGQPRASCISCNACFRRDAAPVHCPLVRDGRLKPPRVPGTPPRP